MGYHRVLCDEDVNLDKLGFGDNIYITLNEDKAVLHISIFQCGHYQDEVLVDLRKEFGTDVDQ